MDPRDAVLNVIALTTVLLFSVALGPAGTVVAPRRVSGPVPSRSR